MLLLVLVAGCSAPPATPAPRPTVGLAVPLSGPNRELGEAAVRAAQIAVGDKFAVKAVDDAQTDAVAMLAASPEVFGVVAHVTRSAIEANVDAWLRADLPVIAAAPGDYRGLARVVPPIEDAARCASTLVANAPYWLRTDGVPSGLSAGNAFLEAAPDHALGLQAVDPADLGHEAAKLKKRRAAAVVWTGDPTSGGNFLRLMRKVGMTTPFIGVGLYDPAFIAAAGSDAEGAVVTSQGRGARDRAFPELYKALAGAPPPLSAVDVYDAAMLLTAAYRVAAEESVPVTRDAIRRALPGAVASGASGSMYLDADGVVQPVLCASFRVVNGAFELENIASVADGIPEEEEPRKRHRLNRD